MKTPIQPPSMSPARNSNIASEPPLDPVAQADQAKAEENQPRRRGIAAAREQRDEAGKLANRARCGQRDGGDAGHHGEQPRHQVREVGRM